MSDTREDTARAFGLPTDEDDNDVVGRHVELTPASAIKPRLVTWLWDGRVAVGTLALLAGRESVGKSTLAYWLAAQVTRGTLPGELFGQPKAVLICATEDSWAHVIVPRLMAADADLERVFRVEVATIDDLRMELSLPHDLADLERAALEADAGLLLLDPLMSRLSSKLDTHRDADVRRALEPLVHLADRTGMATVGLIHHNKGSSTDPLQLIMGSRAFTAVARSVHTVVPDPDDETGQRRLFGTPMNNMGRTDDPTLSFTVETALIPTEDGDAPIGRIVWGEERAEGISETMRRAAEPDDIRTAVAEAFDWLSDYVTVNGGVVPSGDAKKAGKAADHSDNTLQRARRKLGYWVQPSGFPRVTYWGDPTLAQQEPQS